MCLMDLTWSIIPLLQALDGFIIMITRLRKTRNQTLGGLVLDGILEVHQLLLLGNTWSVMYRNTKLLPEILPSKDVSMEGWQLKLG